MSKSLAIFTCRACACDGGSWVMSSLEMARMVREEGPIMCRACKKTFAAHPKGEVHVYRGKSLDHIWWPSEPAGEE